MLTASPPASAIAGPADGDSRRYVGVRHDIDTGGDAFDVLTAAATAAQAAVPAPAVPGASVIIGTHALANAAHRMDSS